jgi:archaellum component FlaC
MSYQNVHTSVGNVQTSVGQSISANALAAPTLKGKINGLEETVKVLTDEVEFYANEIECLRQEK